MTDDEEPRIQMYRLLGRWVFRAPPSGPPTPAQARAREAFARASKSARGRTRDSGLPPAASAVAGAMTGRTFGRVDSIPKWKLLLAAYLVSRGWSVEEAATFLGALG